MCRSCTPVAPLLGVSFLILATLATAARAQDQAGVWPHPDRAGILVIADADADSAGFTWLPWAEQGRRLLVWERGILSIPDSLVVVSDPEGVAVPFRTDLIGTSGGRGLRFEAGSYDFDAPLLLSDGHLQLLATRGRLTVASGRIVYASAAPTADPRASYLFVAALLIISILLLARARAKLQQK